MKYLGRRNFENGINLIQIIPIFGYSVFMPSSYYYSPISRYNINCPLWIQIIDSIRSKGKQQHHPNAVP